MALPLAKLIEGAHGDRDGLRALADASYGYAQGAEPLHAVICLTEAMTFARLAAAHAQRDDRVSLIFLTSALSKAVRQLGEEAMADHFEAQALVLADELAHEGDEESADIVQQAGAILSPAVFAEAKRIRDLLAETVQ